MDDFAESLVPISLEEAMKVYDVEASDAPEVEEIDLDEAAAILETAEE